MGEEHKKYAIYEGILQKINQRCVALPADEKKRNNQFLQVVDRIVQMLRDKNILFDSLYQNKFYGGSFYDGLKIGKPNEYDLDCILYLPKTVEAKIEVSDIPGYVHVILNNFEGLNKKIDEAPKYVGLDKLLSNNYLSTEKLKAWMESLFASVIGENLEIKILIEDITYIFSCRMVKNGPALTLKLTSEQDEKPINLDIDFVPCFIFSNDAWPKEGYKANPTKIRKTFCVVPKSPSHDKHLYWRLSFQEQERELLSKCATMKPALRLIKKVRDRHQHKIASYFIKTIFLWELEKTNKDLQAKSLSFVFAMMLKKYSEYLDKRNIPYYWNDSFNLIGHLSNEVVDPIADRIRNLVQNIDKKCNSRNDIFNIVYFFVAPNEIDLESFKQEVPLSKKLQKQLESQKSEETKVAIISTSPKLDLDETSNDSFPESSSFDDLKQSADFYSLLSTISLDQKRGNQMLEKLVEKVTICENQIKELKFEVEKLTLINTIHTEKSLQLINFTEKKFNHISNGDL